MKILHEPYFAFVKDSYSIAFPSSHCLFLNKINVIDYPPITPFTTKLPCSARSGKDSWSVPSNVNNNDDSQLSSAPHETQTPVKRVEHGEGK